MGGGNNIYKSIFKTQDKDGNSLGCTLKGIEKALKDMNYIGGAIQIMDELFINYNTALYLKEAKGIYSLGGNPDNPSDVDGVEAATITPLEKPKATIPGGGSAAYSKIDKSVTPSGSSESLRFAGVQTGVLEGVNLNPMQEAYQTGDAITLSTKDTDVQIYYAFGDAADPVKEGKVYKEPIVLKENTIIKTCTIDTTGKSSGIKTFNLGVAPEQVSANPESGKIEKGETITLSCKTEGAQIWYTTDGSQPDPIQKKVKFTPNPLSSKKIQLYE